MRGSRWSGNSQLTDRHGTLRGPMYSARGRMSLLFAYCSRMCAVQQLMRLIAKFGV
jgi:hypothetical protein